MKPDEEFEQFVFVAEREHEEDCDTHWNVCVHNIIYSGASKMTKLTLVEGEIGITACHVIHKSTTYTQVLKQCFWKRLKLQETALACVAIFFCYPSLITSSEYRQ